MRDVTHPHDICAMMVWRWWRWRPRVGGSAVNAHVVHVRGVCACAICAWRHISGSMRARNVCTHTSLGVGRLNAAGKHAA